MDGWIVIPGWEKFQHYKDRNPTWIKVYTELNSRGDWLSCSCSARGLLVTCWLEYARGRGLASVRQIASIAGPGYKHAYLKALADAGFIEIVASKPAHVALAQIREEKNKKGASDAPLARAALAPSKSRLPFSGVPGVNGPASDTEAYVRGLVANGVITEPFELNDFELDPAVRTELEGRLH